MHRIRPHSTAGIYLAVFTGQILFSILYHNNTCLPLDNPTNAFKAPGNRFDRDTILRYHLESGKNRLNPGCPLRCFNPIREAAAMRRIIPLLSLLPLLPALLFVPALVAQEKAGDPAKKESESPEPIRMAVFGWPTLPERLCTHLYGGGFETKTFLFETLVKRDAEGRIIPGLASAWEYKDGGKILVLTLRKGAVFHDGRPVDAEIVRWNFQCWIGQPSHAWFLAGHRIKKVVAEARDRVRIEMDRPYALVPDLCAINPTGILGPGSVNQRGFYDKPVGTGAFRFVGQLEKGRVVRYARIRPGKKEPDRRDLIDLIRFGRKGDEAVDALLKESADVMVDAWITRVPRPRIAELKADPEFHVTEAPGSSVMALYFNLENGPAADRRLRLKIRSLIDREALIRAAELGHADPCFSWLAPTVKVWPRSRCEPTAIEDWPRPKAPLRLLVKSDDLCHVDLVPHLAAHLERGGLELKVVSLGDNAYKDAQARGEFDIRIDRTFGVPYDPYISLVHKFLFQGWKTESEAEKSAGVQSDLARLVEEATRNTDPEGRGKVYRKIQDLMDREVILVSLYVPRRVVVVRSGLKPPRLAHDIYCTDMMPVLEGR